MERHPFYAVGVYIGGSDRACAQPNLTASWVTSVTNMGWTLLPIWVGPQNPCWAGSGAKISTNTTTAYSQGQNEARAAVAALQALGISTDSPVTYDMEGANSTVACTAAVQSFMSGWTYYLHLAPAQTSGVYTSACQGNINQFASVSPVVDYIWAANWDGVASVMPIGCVNDGYWTSDQRHKQYLGGHNVTYNGVTINIDTDCSDGPGAGRSDRGYINCS